MHGGERPRTVGPARAAAILYGDWGTSKAYVLGIAFAIAGYSSFPILAAMGVLTALVGLNYYWVCKFHPDGGGVYSAVRGRSRMIACVGALLLIADYLVTASLSVLEGVHYIAHFLEEVAGIHVAAPSLWAIGIIAFIGAINWFGPRHSGSLAVMLAVPAAIAAASIAMLAMPHLGEAHFEPTKRGLLDNWFLFAGIVLALSGVEAVANMTGVMIPDKKRGPDGHVTVRRTSAIAIGIVALEVVGVTVLLAWAMHAMPGIDRGNTDAMLGQMAHHFGGLMFSPAFTSVYTIFVGVVMSLLLFSAANTAIIDMVAIYYLMSKDREMPTQFGLLNRFGVPALPLVLAAVFPCVLLVFFKETTALAALYAIGVVGAITVNLGACATDFKLPAKWPVRLVMGGTAVVMLLIWITIAIEKHEALIFGITVLVFGLFARSFVQERRQTREQAEFRRMLETGFQLGDAATPGEPRVLVALRGVTDTLTFAIEEARQRKGRLGILFVREVRTVIPAEMEVEEDDHAQNLFHAAREAAGDLPLDLIYRNAENVPEMIVQVIGEYGADFIVLGAPAGKAITGVLRGSMANQIAQNLPPGARLLIYSWNAVKKTGMREMARN